MFSNFRNPNLEKSFLSEITSDPSPSATPSQHLYTYYPDFVWESFKTHEVSESNTAHNYREFTDKHYQFARLRTRSDGGMKMSSRLRQPHCGMWKMVQRWSPFFRGQNTCGILCSVIISLLCSLL